MSDSTPFRRVKIVATMSVAVFALTACGGGSTAGSTSGSNAQIDPEAVLRVTAAAPSRNLDPHLQSGYGTFGYLTPLYDRLINVDAADELVPGLAIEWNFADDGSYLELILRDDVSFHDGTAFDAHAVAANIRRGQTLPDSGVAAALGGITSVEIVDPTRVRLHLESGSGAELPSRLATHAGMMISPRAIEAGKDLRNDPGDAGSGAYLVDTYVPLEKLTLVRSDEPYWDPAGGRVAGVEFTTIADAATRLNGLRTGVTDLTWVSSPSEAMDARRLAQSGAIRTHDVQFRNILGILMRSRGALENLELRQAIAHAVDPSEISALFSDTCEPDRQIYPEETWPADPDYLYPYAYDTESARTLAVEAGNATLSLTFAAGTNTEKAANVLQANMSEAGIQVELDPIPNNQLETRSAAGDFDAVVSNSLNPKIDPAETVDLYVTGPYQLGNQNPQIEELARRAADPTMAQHERAELYSQIWSLTLEDALFVPICRQTNVTTYTSKVIGAEDIPFTNTGIFDIRQVAMTS
jgi:peptide/nickel transport system substrate-binding protein